MNNLFKVIVKCNLIIVIILVLTSYCECSYVEICGNYYGEFELLVDGTPFYIKGIGYNSTDSSRYDQDFSSIRAMGGNTIRFWGTNQCDINTLNKANAYGLKVIIAYWLKQDIDYSTDYDYRDRVIEEIIEWVRQNRDHPAVLMWLVGNEVFHYLPQTPNRENNKIAFCQFLDQLCIIIHQVEQEVPNSNCYHPVVYAGVGLEPIEYFKSYTTNLDVYGANTYGQTNIVCQDYETKGYKKPLLFTEFGCNGHWEWPYPSGYEFNDPRADRYKAEQYRQRWIAIKNKKGTDLGGCAFSWIDTNDNLTVWRFGITEINTIPRYRCQYYYLKDVWRPMIKKNLIFF